MTTSLDTLIVPVRYYSALDPYNWKVDNRPLSDLEDNDDVLKSGIETCLNAAKVGAAVDGRLLKALVGPYNAVGYWEPSASGVALEIYNTIKVSTVTDDSHDVDLIAIQYSPAVFALPTPSSGSKVLATIYAKYQLPSTPEMPYYDPTQALDALGTTVGTLQTKQGNIEFAIATTVVADTDPDNYPSPAVGYDTLFNIKVDSTDTVLDPDKIIAVGISTLGQAIAKATTTSYGQVRFATNTEVVAGTSTDTVVSPADLATKAALGGNNTVNFKVKDAVSDDDAVNLGQLSSDLNFSNVVEYTTPNTYTFTVPAGIRKAIFDIQAGGGGGGQGGGSDGDLGGGGGENGAGGSGGASGQFIRVLAFGLVPGQNISITVGNGGVRGGVPTGTAAGPGLASTVNLPGGQIIAKGGLPGIRGNRGDDNGSDPSYRQAGGQEQIYFPISTLRVIASLPFQQAGEGGGQVIQGAKGGDSPTYLGGPGGIGNTGGAGTQGSGGGGGAGQAGSSTNGYAGGKGGDGFVKVYY